MLKIIVTLLALSGICLAEGSTWTNWNSFAVTNKSTINSGFTIPTPPSPFARDTQSNYSIRSNQYHYVGSITVYGYVYKCNVYCGLRSFLVTDQSGNLFCKRDINQYFWGSFSGQYSQYCIPDVDSLQACKIVFPSSTPLIGACKTSVYNLNSSSVYYNKQCCYNDQNQIAGGNPDITTKGVATSLYDLVNSEN